MTDLGDGYVSAVQRLPAGGSAGAFNLATGHDYSVKQVLDAIAAETGGPASFVSFLGAFFGQSSCLSIVYCYGFLERSLSAAPNE